MIRSTAVTASELQNLDLQSVWHPLTQHRDLDKAPPLVIESASGCFVVAEGVRRYLDGVSENGAFARCPL